jgi:hypothetical protein
MFGMIDYLPTFGPDALRRERFVQFCSQLAPTPQIVLKMGSHLQGVYFRQLVNSVDLRSFTRFTMSSRLR